MLTGVATTAFFLGIRMISSLSHDRRPTRALCNPKSRERKPLPVFFVVAQWLKLAA
jgi:hypothetical protein